MEQQTQSVDASASAGFFVLRTRGKNYFLFLQQKSNNLQQTRTISCASDAGEGDFFFVAASLAAREAL
jgi:hypothetical protein